MTLLQKIIKEIQESDHEVVLELQSALNKHLADDDEYYVRLVKEWLDDLQEMHDKAEKVDELKTTISTIDELTDEATGVIDQIRRYCND